MLGIILSIGLLGVLIYIFHRARIYLNVYKKAKVLGLSFLGFYFFGGFSTLYIGFLSPTGSYIKQLFTKLSFYWLGTLLYFAIGLLISIIFRNIVYKVKTNANRTRGKQLTVLFTFIFTILMSLEGIMNAHDLKVTNYEIEVNKKSNINELNVVLVADLHYGYNVGLKETIDMVNTINSLNPDVVIVAGDIFDNEYDALYEPEKVIEQLQKINSKYGVYATYGNHDIEEKIFLGFTFKHSNKKDKCADERMIKFIEDSNMKILYDDYVMIDDIYLYGRPDYEKPNLHNETRLSEEELISKMDNSKPIIVIDHEPRGTEELSKLGVDVLLNGHTHDGQIWPGTITINWIWDNAYGYKQYGNLHNIVTSGVGLFGVNMRTDSIAEVCDIKVKFK